MRNHFISLLRFSCFRLHGGYTGYTKSVVDGNEILKSFITIYDVNNLSEEELGTILRHEFGHALRLNSNEKFNNLMAIEIIIEMIKKTIHNVQSIYDV